MLEKQAETMVVWSVQGASSASSCLALPWQKSVEQDRTALRHSRGCSWREDTQPSSEHSSGGVSPGEQGHGVTQGALSANETNE